MPYRYTLIVAAFVVFLLAIPMLPVRINLVALGLALLVLALYLLPGSPPPP